MGTDNGGIRLGKAFSFSMEIFARNLGVLLPMTAVPLLPSILIDIFAKPSSFHSGNAVHGLSMGHMSPALGLTLLTVGIASALFFIVANVGVSLTMAVVVQQSVLDREVPLTVAVKIITPRIWPAILTGALTMLILLGWSLLLVIPGFIFSFYYMFMNEAVALRGADYMAALRYSKDLVKGHWWQVFGILFVFGILAAVAVGVPSAIVMFTIGKGVVAKAVYYVVYLFVMAYFYVLRVVLFLALECLKGQGVVSACAAPAPHPDPAAAPPPAAPSTSEGTPGAGSAPSSESDPAAGTGTA